MKILVIRLSSIGDIVLTTPVVRCLKKQLEGAEIHYAVKEQFAPVISANPYIDKLHLFRGDLPEFTRELRSENFDYIADLHHNLRSNILRVMLRKPGRHFPKLNLEKWLLVKFRINRLPAVHIVDRYFRAVTPMGVSNDGKGLDYFIRKEDEVDLHDLPSPWNDGFIAVVTGAKHFTKKMPEEQLASICRRINTPVILMGGPEDFPAGERIRELAGPMVFNGCGLYSLNQSASLIRQAGSVITHDTGLMHIAAAFRKNIISIWGNTVPEFGMYPYLPAGEGKSSVIEVKGLNCRPCSKLGYSRCPKGHFRCMRDIRDEAVLEAL